MILRKRRRRNLFTVERPTAAAVDTLAAPEVTATDAAATDAPPPPTPPPPPPPPRERARLSAGRLAAHAAMLVLLAAAAWLRLAGAYWGNQGMHPDERGIYMRIGEMKVVPTEAAERSPLGAFLWSLDTNLRVGAANARLEGDQQDLNPEHFAYGSLFYTASVAASHLATHLRDNAADWNRFGWLLLVLAVLVPLGRLGVVLSGRRLPDAARSFLTRLALAAAFAAGLVWLLLCGAEIAHTAHPPHPDVFGYWNAWFVARPLSAIFGILTTLVLYRIGCRFFDAGTGLLAAAFLAFTVLHVQLSHYCASDTMLALWAALAVLYCCHIATRARFGDFLWAGLFIGAAIATKFSAVLLPPLYVLAFGLSWYSRGRERALERAVAFVAGGVLAALTLLWAQPFAWVEEGMGGPHASLPGGPSALISLGAATVGLLALLGLAAVVRMATTGGVTSFLVAAALSAVLASVSVVGWLVLALMVGAMLLRLRVVRLPRRFHIERPRWGLPAAVAALLLFAGLFPLVYKAVREAEGLPSVFGPSPLTIVRAPDYPYLGSQQFRHDTKEQSVMAQGKVFVWTIQYEHTPPVIYQIRNLMQLSMGTPLTLLCLAGLAWLIGRAVATWHRPSLVIVAWILANALVIGSFQTKFARYMAPYLPFLCFAGAALVARFVWGGEPARGRTRAAVAVLAVLALAGSALYSWSFVRTVYLEPHTKFKASRWIYQNIPPGTPLVEEHWDDELPVDLEGRRLDEYPRVQLPIYDDDFHRISETEWDTANPNHGKHGFIADHLERGQYVILASRKLYGAVMRQENKRYKLATQFYKLLFSGRLGFTHVATFTNPPRLLGIPIDEDLGEESFTIYDHPKICIFKKTRPLGREAYLRLLTTAPPADVALLTMEDIMRAEAGRPIWQKRVRLAPVRYWLVLELLTLIAIPYLFRAFGGVSDRGLLLAKPVGVLLMAYGAWVVSAAHLMPYGVTSMLLVLAALGAGAGLLAYRQREALRDELRVSWWPLLGAELAFGGVFGIFLYIRRMNPDIRWSEKFMDFSFLTAAYRTDFFPLKDPWISGFDVNYYYWGQVLYATLGRLAGVPPEAAYNLACATAPALAFTAALAVGRLLTRRFRYGLLAGFLAVFAGSLVGYLQIARNLDRQRSEERQELPRLAAGQRWDKAAFEYAGAAPAVSKAAWGTLKSLDDGVLPEGMQRGRIGFDSYFWLTGHYAEHHHQQYRDLPAGVVANEFPMWTYLHADLHAHLIVMAFTLTFVGLLATLVTGGGSGARLFGVGSSWLFGVGLLGLTLGAISCINTWDVPTVTLLLVGALVLKAYAHRRGATAEQRRFVATLASTGVTSLRKLRLHLLARLVAVDVVLPLLAVIGLAYLLYWPFHTYFVPRATKVRLTDMSFTPVESFLKIFGLFVLVAVPFLLLALARWAMSTRRGLVAAALGVGALAVAGLLYPSWSVGWTPSPEPPSGVLGTIEGLLHRAGAPLGNLVRSVWWSLPLEREMPGPDAFRPQWGLLVLLLPLLFINGLLLLRKAWTAPVRFALLLSAAALGILCGCEIVYVFETWGGVNQRWNTPFKFYLQAWLLLALAVPIFWRAVWTARPAGLLAPWARGGRLVWTALVIAVFGAVSVFPIFGAYAVLWGEGARGAYGPRPSLDGLGYLDREDDGRLFPGEREAIAWFNRMVKGNKAVVMEAAPGYYNELGRWGAFTGMPSVLGWDHHVGERGHHTEKMPRMADVHRFYQSLDRNECLGILRKYGVDYVIVGELERSRWHHAGQPFATNTEKLRQWPDVFEPVFDSSRETPGLVIYRVRRDLLP